MIRIIRCIYFAVAGLLEGSGLYWPKHSCAACLLFKRWHPSWKIVKTQTRAWEPDRYVVAIFYTEPGYVSFPIEYKLIAVARDLSRVQELPEDPDSPYRLMDYK